MQILLDLTQDCVLMVVCLSPTMYIRANYYFYSQDYMNYPYDNNADAHNTILSILSPDWVWYPDIGLLNAFDPGNNPTFIQQQVPIFFNPVASQIGFFTQISLAGSCFLAFLI